MRSGVYHPLSAEAIWSSLDEDLVSSPGEGRESPGSELLSYSWPHRAMLQGLSREQTRRIRDERAREVSGVVGRRGREDGQPDARFAGGPVRLPAGRRRAVDRRDGLAPLRGRRLQRLGHRGWWLRVRHE